MERVKENFKALAERSKAIQSNKESNQNHCGHLLWPERRNEQRGQRYAESIRMSLPRYAYRIQQEKQKIQDGPGKIREAIFLN